MLYIFQADKSLRLLAFLQNTLGSAADRTNKSDFRGRCATVNYRTVINLTHKGLSGVTKDRPPSLVSWCRILGDGVVMSFNVNKRNFHLASVVS